MPEITNNLDCWNAAYRFQSRGDHRRAMEICTGDPCADVLECQNYLGWRFYEQGDMKQAIQWFNRAAEKENANASYGIACVHYAENNYTEALRYFSDASERGCSRAFHWIGYMYHKGIGVSVDLKKAADFYEKGVANGYLIAQHALIRLTFQTSGIFMRLCILPKYFYLILKTAVVSRNANDPRFADFLVLGPSINGIKATMS